MLANDGISLALRRGEVLALLGENGAGKSTLVSILFGHYVADAGTVEVDGRPLPPGDTRAALAAGIGMVHQHFTLADNLSVLDNVMLGTEPLWQPFSRRAAARARLLEASRRFGLAVEPDTRVGELSVGERQRVEILKALTRNERGARVLILDEPTAVLTPPERDALFATLRRFVDAGLAVIFISHKLDEVLAVSQRVAVLRAGRLVADLDAGAVDPALLAEAMVGRAVPAPRRHGATRGDLVCELREVSVRGSGPRAELDAADLALHAGEIVAIAGVAGNGQRALADLLHGLRRPDAGELRLFGAPAPVGARAWVRAGVARIPEDRQAAGVVGDLAVWENAVLERHASPAFARAGVLRRARARAHAQSIVERFDVRGLDAQGLDTPTRALSGGNMQKLILGRALSGEGDGDGDGDPARRDAPKLIVADQPTWGLDVGAVAYVHQRLLDAAAAGGAVLLISEDLDEIFALADRIAVLHRGRLGPARPAREWTLAAIGRAMSGLAADAAGDAHAEPAAQEDPHAA